MIVSFYRRGAACFSARKLFCGTLFAKGGGHLIPLYAPLRVAAHIKILLFGPITHHAVIVTLTCFLVVTRGRDFIRHIKYSVRRALFRDGGHAFRQEN
jgi:hypothetical protein